MNSLEMPFDWRWLVAAIVAVVALFLFVVVRKSRTREGEHVYKASRLSKGNRLLPAQVIVTPSSITLFKPQWIGKLEQSIHIAHVASIKIDTNVILSDIFIETTGGHNPIVYHGHTKGDAVDMKKVVEQYQSEYYRKA